MAYRPYLTVLLIGILVYLTAESESLPSLRSCEAENKRPDYVNCRRKNFQHIPSDIFNTTKKYVYLAKNPYICDCEILWFIERMKRQDFDIKIMDEELLRCDQPRALKGRRLRDLNKSDVCRAKSCYNETYCSLHADCVEEKGNNKCVCKKGFTGNGTHCFDIDECASRTDTCDKVFTVCHNTIGSYECRCKLDYQHARATRACTAVNPCEEIFQPCNPFTEVCVNRGRSFNCQCKNGFYNQSAHNKCTDRNECRRKRICSQHAQCINLIGSYHCHCRQGYTGDGKLCEDLNECIEGTHNCHKDAVCLNHVGGYKCQCKPGFQELKNGVLCKKESDTRWIAQLSIGAMSSVSVFSLVLLVIYCCRHCFKGRRKKKRPVLTSEPSQTVKTAEFTESNVTGQNAFFLPDEDQLQQQMFIFDNYYDEDMASKGILPNFSNITAWSEDDEDYLDDSLDDETY